MVGEGAVVDQLGHPVQAGLHLLKAVLAPGPVALGGGGGGLGAVVRPRRGLGLPILPGNLIQGLFPAGDLPLQPVNLGRQFPAAVQQGGEGLPVLLGKGFSPFQPPGQGHGVAPRLGEEAVGVVQLDLAQRQAGKGRLGAAGLPPNLGGQLLHLGRGAHIDGLVQVGREGVHLGRKLLQGTQVGHLGLAAVEIGLGLPLDGKAAQGHHPRCREGKKPQPRPAAAMGIVHHQKDLLG